MKRFLVIMGLAASFICGCTKETVQPANDGETVSVSFTAALSNVASTKATADGDGTGVYADQCKMQVWWGDVLFCEKTVPVTSYGAKFENIVLLKNQTYDFLFWADNAAGAYYVTDTLTQVKLDSAYVGGDDKRDAFFAAVNGKTVTAAFSETITLYRPFAQLNVITTDIPSLYNQVPDSAQLAAIIPDSVKVKVNAPTVFNVKTGVASEYKDLSYEEPVYADSIKTSTGDRNTLSMDYFYAPADGDVVTVYFTAKNTTAGIVPVNYEFPNVPLKRNYRTNIIGALITVVGTVEVEIDPNWDGEINK